MLQLPFTVQDTFSEQRWDTVRGGFYLHKFEAGETMARVSGPAVTRLEALRGEGVGPTVRSQTAANQTQSALQAKENSKKKKTNSSPDELLSVLMAVLDD